MNGNSVGTKVTSDEQEDRKIVSGSHGWNYPHRLKFSKILTTPFTIRKSIAERRSIYTNTQSGSDKNITDS